MKENGAGATNRVQDLLKRLDIGKRSKEAVVATHAKQTVDTVADTGFKVLSKLDEVSDQIRGKADTVKDRFTQGKEYMEMTADNLRNAFYKDLNDDRIVAEAKRAGVDITDKVRTRVEALLEREVFGRLTTLVNDKANPILSKLGLSRKESVASQTEEINVPDRSSRKAANIIEGSALVDAIAEPFKAGKDYDQAKGDAVPKLIETAFGSSELAGKYGPAMLQVMRSIALQSAGFGAESSESMNILDELANDPDVQKEMAENKVNIFQLGAEMSKILRQISEAKQAALESRGESRGISWEYERDQAKASEEVQAIVHELGWKVVDSLPESATELTLDQLMQARVVATKFSQRSIDVIRPLKKIAISMENRFPNKVDEIRAALAEAVAPWKISKAIVRGVVESSILDEETTKQTSKDIFSTIIQPNELFAGLSAEQQTVVMEKIGGTLIDAKLDNIKEGSIYEQTVQAYGEYAQLVVSYDSLREHVQDHPEAADQLMVLAERIMQAKSVMELAKHKMKSEVIVQSRKQKNSQELASSKASNATIEVQSKNARREYYTKTFDDIQERIQNEGPTLKKIINRMGIATLAITGLVAAGEVGPEILEAMIELAKYLVHNVPVAIRVGAVGSGLFGVAHLLRGLRAKMGLRAGEAAVKGRETLAVDNSTSIDQLKKIRDELLAVDNNSAAAGDIDKVIESMQKN
ncbi:hypothetical protein KKD03_00705 [Patescibacteria group bacterium]|nr:hypothetical protein [Patescibacteria group bacterium]